MSLIRLMDSFRAGNSSLEKNMEEWLSEYCPGIKVGKISHPHNRESWDKHYFIQFTFDGYPNGAHYEYHTDSWRGYLEFHLEPAKDNFQVLKKIGIRMAHKLNNGSISYCRRGDLPFGCFWSPNYYNGISDKNGFISEFRTLYEAIHPLLIQLSQEVKEVFLQTDKPIATENLKEPLLGGTEVTSEIRTLEEVMNFNLTLPDYQRDYCWEERNISDLWNNLLKIEVGKAFHLGTLIFHANRDRENNQRKYDIIDGQQRLVTLSLILWGLGYTGNIPLLNAKYSSHDAIKNVGNSKYVIKSLIERAGNTSDILPRILKNVSFAVLVVNDANLDLAYTFFSNQNSKGVPLSDFDLLKAHHLRFIPGDEGGQAEHMAKKWNAVSQQPPSYKESNSLERVLGTHLYRLRKWMRKHESKEGSYRYIQREFQAAHIMNDIPPFGEQFMFYEKIQGGTHFFVYAETFIHRYEQFCELKPVKLLRSTLSDGRYSLFADTIETLLFGYYLKFGNQYLPEALYCISRLMALYRYNTYAVARTGVGVRSFANNGEVVLMIDQATSPTFFLAEMIDKFEELTAGDFPIRTGLDLDEAHGVRWGIYEALRNIFRNLIGDVTETQIRNKIIEEYGK